MAINKSRLKYIPGTYAQKRPDSAQLAGQYINEWSQRQLKMKDKKILSACTLELKGGGWYADGYSHRKEVKGGE